MYVISTPPAALGPEPVACVEETRRFKRDERGLDLDAAIEHESLQVAKVGGGVAAGCACLISRDPTQSALLRKGIFKKGFTVYSELAPIIRNQKILPWIESPVS